MGYVCLQTRGIPHSELHQVKTLNAGDEIAPKAENSTSDILGVLAGTSEEGPEFQSQP